MVARRRVSRGTSNRRKLVWARIAENQFSLPSATFNAANLLVDFETAYGANLIGCTVVRVRLRWSSFVADTTGQQVTAAGIRVADDADITSSAPADPLGPLSDLHADWMAWDTSHPSLVQPAASTAEGPLLSRYVDIKAMRKIEELGQGIYLFFESTVTGAATTVFNYSVSTLLALP